MNIIFAGTPDFAAHALKALIDADYTVCAVYTQPDRPAGRGRKLTASAVKTLAQSYDIPVCQPEHFRAGTPEGLQAQHDLKRRIDEHAVTVMIVAAYGLILPQAVLDMPPLGCLNIHASLLPRWRGAAPIQRAMLAGDTRTGITIMQMNAGLDTGDMLYKMECDILPTDTVTDLHDRLAQLGGQSIVYTLQHLAPLQKNATPQLTGLVTYAHKITKAEAHLNLSHSALELARQVRAFLGWPVAFVMAHDQPMRILKAEALTGTYLSCPIGQIVVLNAQGIEIACGARGTERLCLSSVQFAGGKPVTPVQVLQGGQLTLNDCLT